MSDKTDTAPNAYAKACPACDYNLRYVGLVAMDNGVSGMEMWRWQCLNPKTPHVVLVDLDEAMQDEEYARLHEGEDEGEDRPDFRYARGDGYVLEAYVSDDKGYTYTIRREGQVVDSGFVGFALFEGIEARNELERRLATAPALYDHLFAK